MYAYIKGTVISRKLDSLVVENQGMGYLILASPGLMEKFPAVGEFVTVFTHLYVREDQMSLYGFPGGEDLNMFELLLTVSGIGPKVASTIVGTLSPGQFAMAVLSGDTNALTQVRGIGRKGAERLILELKDKLKGMDVPQAAGIRAAESSASFNEGGSLLNDTVSALVVLGYSSGEAAKAVYALDQNQVTNLEDYIRLALRQLMKQ